MKSLTGTLLTAQKKARGTPYIQLLLQDRLGANQRLTWSDLYSDAEDDQPHAMCIAGDDSIVRVMSDGDGDCFFQRVTDPTEAAQWEAWTDESTACSDEQQMYLVSQASGGYVWWFYISRSETVVYCKESDDYGASFGGRNAVYTCGGSDKLESVCAAVSAGTDLICFFSAGVPDSDDIDLFRAKRAAGAWGGASGWGKTKPNQIRGLTCHKTDDYNILYGAGVDAVTFGFGDEGGAWVLFAIVYGNGVNQAADTWSNPVVVERTDAGTSFASAWPSLTYVDLHRALFTGYLVGEEYSRVVRMRGIYGADFISTEWTDPFPFKAEGGPFGMVIDYRSGGDGYVYTACSNAAYRAKAAGDADVDVSARVMKYKAIDRWTGHKASGVSIDYGKLIAPETHCEIWLDNSDGGLNTLGSGSFASFKRGSRVVLRRGYETTDGDEYAQWVDLWLEDYEYVADFKGKSYLVMYCIGPWELLSAMAAQRQYTIGRMTRKRWLRSLRACWRWLASS